MKISRQQDDHRTSMRRQETFSGHVWSESLSDDVPQTMINNVWFAPGSRTHWHRHEDGQILHVTEGQGRIGTRNSGAVIIRPGDTVWADPDEEHYHGADLDRHFSHLAITLGDTEWLEPVSDEDYGTAAHE